MLDDYIRTPEVFREFSEKTGVPGGLPELPGRVNGPHGPRWEERGAAREGRAPPPPSGPNWTRRGGAPPSFLPPLPFPSPPSRSRKGGVLLLLGGGFLLPWRAQRGRQASPSLLYIRGQGAPHRHKLIYGSFLSRVRCPLPPYSTSVISSRSLGEALCR